MTEDSIIHIEDLWKIYDNDGTQTEALRGVNLSVKKGEFVAIMGPSGSGKSTMLQILGLLDEYTKGHYHFAGKNIRLYNQDEVAKIRNQKMGFVFQAFNLLPHSTVLDNVKLPLLYSDRPEEEWEALAQKAVTDVGLAHRMYHDTTQLSGGERQRVAIARALVNEPAIIFADEPTGNLDSKSGQTIIEIIQKLNTELGHTIVLITHETYTAEYAERVVHIRDGQVEREEKVMNRRKAGDTFIK